MCNRSVSCLLILSTYVFVFRWMFCLQLNWIQTQDFFRLPMHIYLKRKKQTESKQTYWANWTYKCFIIESERGLHMISLCCSQCSIDGCFTTDYLLHDHWWSKHSNLMSQGLEITVEFLNTAFFIYACCLLNQYQTVPGLALVAMLCLRRTAKLYSR